MRHRGERERRVWRMVRVSEQGLVAREQGTQREIGLPLILEFK